MHMAMLVEEWNRDDSLRLAESERLAKAAEAQARMRETLARASRLEVRCPLLSAIQCVVFVYDCSAPRNAVCS
jgi:hypothetical protein